MTEASCRDGDSEEAFESLDEILEILSNYQRRSIIQHLRDAPGHVHSIDGVIDHLQRLERQRHGDAPGEDHILSVLVHVHGPKLDNAGLVDYDIPSRQIRYYPDERYELILEQIEAIAEEFNQI